MPYRTWSDPVVSINHRWRLLEIKNSIILLSGKDQVCIQSKLSTFNLKLKDFHMHEHLNVKFWYIFPFGFPFLTINNHGSFFLLHFCIFCILFYFLTFYCDSRVAWRWSLSYRRAFFFKFIFANNSVKIPTLRIFNGSEKKITSLIYHIRTILFRS